MRRFFKVIVWIVGSLAALIAAVAIYILLIFDPNKYKAEIAAAVHDATGRELNIQGELKLSFFPWMGVETQSLSLSNPPDFGQAPFAKIESAAIKVKLLPLFKKDVEVDTITLNGLYLQLIRTATGQNNWDDLGTQAGKETPAPAGTNTTSTNAAAPLLTAFAIGGIQIRDATVIWDDRQSKTRYALNKLSLRTGPISLVEPVALKLETDFISDAPALSAHLGLSTEASYKLDTRQLRLKGVQLTARMHGVELGVQEATLALSGDALLKLAEQQYQITDLKLLTSLQGEQFPGKRIEAKLNANVGADLHQGTLTIKPFNLEAWNIKVNGAVHGNGLLDAPRFSGNITIPSFNARELLGHFSKEPLDTADPQALSAVSAVVAFKASPTNAELTKLEATLDQSRISGNAALIDFSRPAYRFQLAVDDIDADRYLPHPSSISEPATAMR